MIRPKKMKSKRICSIWKGISGGSRISRGGGANPSEGAPTLLSTFPENSMKLQEFGPRGGASKILLCRSATGNTLKFNQSSLVKV